MSYIHSDPSRENDVNATPDVEIFPTNVAICTNQHCEARSEYDKDDWGNRTKGLKPCPICGHDRKRTGERSWFYAFGFPGCIWDSVPIGPFDSFDEAVADARAE
jgi:hypothetical protein